MQGAFYLLLCIYKVDTAIAEEVNNMGYNTVNEIIDEWYFDYVYLNGKCWYASDFIAHTKRFKLGGAKFHYEISTINDQQVLSLY